MCGVIGVYYPGVPVILDSILSSEFMYHRGHDSSGIAVPHNGEITRIADAGFFGDWPEKRREEIIDVAKNDLVALHIRYSTIGSKEKLLRNAHRLLYGPKRQALMVSILTPVALICFITFFLLSGIDVRMSMAEP